MPDLSLQLSRRDALFRRGQQVHGDKPILERQLRAVHHRAGAKRRPMAAMPALELLLTLQPDDICAAAMLTHHTLLLPHRSESFPARSLIREILVKIENLHKKAVLLIHTKLINLIIFSKEI